MNPPPPQLEFVAVMTTLASVLFGREMAGIVGPYAAIIFGAAIGGFLSASRRPQTTRTATFAYVVLIVLVALLFTATASQFVSSYFKFEDARPFFGPVAFVIAWVGPDWPKAYPWAVSLVRAFIERRIGAAPPNQPPPGGSA